MDLDVFLRDVATIELKVSQVNEILRSQECRSVPDFMFNMRRL